MTDEKVSVLLIGRGVIGSVYAGQLALAGHSVSALAHGEREKDVSTRKLRLENIVTGTTDSATIGIVANAASQTYDVVLVAVHADQLESTFSSLHSLTGRPHIVFFGNNPDGHATIPNDLPGTVQLAFPGIGGKMTDDGVVEYTPVDQQPTTFETTDKPYGVQFAEILKQCGFAVQTVDNIDGWLAYHTVFISCMSMAILKCDGNPAKLGHDRAGLKQLCLAITEGFGALKRNHVGGAPKNLALLHNRLLLAIAMNYWGKLLRSPKGERYFGDHARHAPDEVSTLSDWVLEHYSSDMTPHLTKLLKK